MPCAWVIAAARQTAATGSTRSARGVIGQDSGSYSTAATPGESTIRSTPASAGVERVLTTDQPPYALGTWRPVTRKVQGESKARCCCASGNAPCERPGCRHSRSIASLCRPARRVSSMHAPPSAEKTCCLGARGRVRSMARLTVGASAAPHRREDMAPAQAMLAHHHPGHAGQASVRGSVALRSADPERLAAIPSADGGAELVHLG